MHTAAYLRNRTLTSGRSETAYQLFWQKKPGVSHLRDIGTKVFIMEPRAQLHKLDDRGTEGKLISYDLVSKAYRVLLTDNRTVKKSRSPAALLSRARQLVGGH